MVYLYTGVLLWFKVRNGYVYNICRICITCVIITNESCFSYIHNGDIN